MTKGILYFLHSKKGKLDKGLMWHYNFGVNSAKSARAVGLNTILYTNVDEIEGASSLFDEVVYYKGADDLWVYKFECLPKSPFDLTIHLDLDTYLILWIFLRK